MELHDAERIVEAVARANAKPTEELVAKCGRYLEGRGWLRGIAGEENFRRGARAWASALLNGKGIIAIGPNGTGKSRYLEAVTATRGMAVKRFYLKCARDRDCLDMEENREYCEELMRFHVLLDDLGAEPPKSRFGVVCEPVFDFIMDYTYNGRGNLYISTNLWQAERDNPGGSLTGRYSGRIDCLKECVVPVLFEGESVRQWGGAVGAK